MTRRDGGIYARGVGIIPGSRYACTSVSRPTKLASTTLCQNTNRRMRLSSPCWPVAAEATTMLRRMTEAMPSPASYAEAARTYRALGDERGAQAILRYARRRFPDSEILKQLAQAA